MTGEETCTLIFLDLVVSSNMKIAINFHLYTVLPMYIVAYYPNLPYCLMVVCVKALSERRGNILHVQTTLFYGCL